MLSKIVSVTGTFTSFFHCLLTAIFRCMTFAVMSATKVVVRERPGFLRLLSLLLTVLHGQRCIQVFKFVGPLDPLKKIWGSIAKF